MMATSEPIISTALFKYQLKVLVNGTRLILITGSPDKSSV